MAELSGLEAIAAAVEVAEEEEAEEARRAAEAAEAQALTSTMNQHQQGPYDLPELQGQRSGAVSLRSVPVAAAMASIPVGQQHDQTKQLQHPQHPLISSYRHIDGSGFPCGDALMAAAGIDPWVATGLREHDLPSAGPSDGGSAVTGGGDTTAVAVEDATRLDDAIGGFVASVSAGKDFGRPAQEVTLGVRLRPESKSHLYGVSQVSSVDEAPAEQQRQQRTEARCGLSDLPATVLHTAADVELAKLAAMGDVVELEAVDGLPRHLEEPEMMTNAVGSSSCRAGALPECAGLGPQAPPPQTSSPFRSLMAAEVHVQQSQAPLSQPQRRRRRYAYEAEMRGQPCDGDIVDAFVENSGFGVGHRNEELLHPRQRQRTDAHIPEYRISRAEFATEEYGSCAEDAVCDNGDDDDDDLDKDGDPIVEPVGGGGGGPSHSPLLVTR